MILLEKQKRDNAKEITLNLRFDDCRAPSELFTLPQGTRADMIRDGTDDRGQITTERYQCKIFNGSTLLVQARVGDKLIGQLSVEGTMIDGFCIHGSAIELDLSSMKQWQGLALEAAIKKVDESKMAWNAKCQQPVPQ